jgi:hypothetical protein
VNADLGEKHGVFGCVYAGPQSAKHIIGNQERCLRLNHTNLDIPTGQRHKQGILADYRAIIPKTEDSGTWHLLGFLCDHIRKTLQQIMDLLLTNDRLACS